MITKWKLFNFKSVRQETELDFGPLTILAGANSSGKSTLIQSMLLISQTVSSKVPSQSVVLNGSLIKLGQFSDIKTQNNDADQILIGWTCKTMVDEATAKSVPMIDPERMSYYSDYGIIREVSMQISFDTKAEDSRLEIAQLHPGLFATQMRALIKEGDGTEREASLTINRRQQQFIDKELNPSDIDYTLLKYDVTMDEKTLAETKRRFSSAVPIGSTIQHFFPEILTIKYNVIKERAKQFYSALVEAGIRPGGARSQRFANTLIPNEVLSVLRRYLGEESDLLSQALSGQAGLFAEAQAFPFSLLLGYMNNLPFKERKAIRTHLDDEGFFKELLKAFLNSDKEQFKITKTRFPEPIRDAISYTRTNFSRGMKYLGPLRDEPKPLYPLSAATDPKDVGLKGEYTAAVLNLYQNELISYIPTSAFSKPQIDRQPATRKLQTAVVDWLTYFGVANDVITEDKGKLGHQLQITPDSTMKPIDLTHVGVGVSQVLPILVSCLLADSDTTLIFEQPELHLHPKVQTLLGDFFLSMALLKKQCILETHSEYLINRLRYRAAAEDNENYSSILKMYFVEQDRGTSQFRRVEVNEYGAILDWPKGFFDQSQREAEQILRYGIRKRKNRSEENSK